MRIVIDTNVLISHVMWPESKPATIVNQLFRNHSVLRSTDSFSELSQVLMRRKFDKYVSIAHREKFLGYFEALAEAVPITQRINACRDPRDNMFLELAVCGKADMILSGDADLLVLDAFLDIRIINPTAFVV